VTGIDADTAQARIEALGLKVRTLELPFGVDAPVGSQIPSAGTEVPPDATVTLRIGAG
jgi:beta-lactam-binding protein with PASTA domain